MKDEAGREYLKLADAQSEAMREALEFYRGEAEALARYMAEPKGSKADSILASVTVLSLDGGRRASVALSETKPAQGAKLATLILEYARDLRRNSSGGDNYPWEYVGTTADYLEELVRRSETKPALYNALRDIISIARDAHATDALGDIAKRAEEGLGNVK